MIGTLSFESIWITAVTNAFVLSGIINFVSKMVLAMKTRSADEGAVWVDAAILTNKTGFPTRNDVQAFFQRIFVAQIFSGFLHYLSKLIVTN